jgi:hypothetical protein
MQMTNEISRYQLVTYLFHQDAVADSQSAGAMNTVEAEGVVQTNTGYACPWPFQIVGVSVLSGEARTAGTLTVDPTIGGTVTGLNGVLDATNTTSHSARQIRESDEGAAGAIIGCKLTTASWTPVTADINVAVYVLVDLKGTV